MSDAERTEMKILRALCGEMLRQGSFDWRPAMKALYDEGETEAGQAMAMWLLEASIPEPDPRDKFKVIDGGAS